MVISNGIRPIPSRSGRCRENEGILRECTRANSFTFLPNDFYRTQIERPSRSLRRNFTSCSNPTNPRLCLTLDAALWACHGRRNFSLAGVYVLFFYFFFSRRLAILLRKQFLIMFRHNTELAQSQSASVKRMQSQMANSLHATLVPRRSLQLRDESRFDRADHENFRGLG